MVKKNENFFVAGFELFQYNGSFVLMGGRACHLPRQKEPYRKFSNPSKFFFFQFFFHHFFFSLLLLWFSIICWCIFGKKYFFRVRHTHFTVFSGKNIQKHAKPCKTNHIEKFQTPLKKEFSTFFHHFFFSLLLLWFSIIF